MKHISVEEMLQQEQNAINNGTGVNQLIQNAGQNLAFAIDRRAIAGRRSIVAMVGKGNNGADALVALSQLAQIGWKTRALIMVDRHDDWMVQQASAAGVEVRDAILAGDHLEMAQLLGEPAILLDALLGTGFQGHVKPELAKRMQLVVHALDYLPKRPIVVAVDCPSGVNCSTGHADPAVIPANLTICMGACKAGLLLQPAFGLVGELASAGIGIDIEDGAAGPLQVVEAADVMSVLPKREWNTHKGGAGKMLICGGSVEYIGAPVLSGLGAYTLGAGLVRMAVPAIVQSSAASKLPEAIWTIMPTVDGAMSEDGTELLLRATKGCKAVVIGPGMGPLPASQKLVKSYFSALLAGFEPHNRPIGFGSVAEKMGNRVDEDTDWAVPPMVVDADGLRNLAMLPQWWNALPAGCILTPHPGEMAALTGASVAELQTDRLASARKAARAWGCVVLFKGAQTVVAEPKGHAAIIPIAEPALAKAGTGDVLAGVIGALLAQGLDSFSAAWAGAWLHARAGQFVRARHGNNLSPIASELTWGLRRVLGLLEQI